jgi:hypothetical protein
MRDPALASLLGIEPQGGTFGGETRFGAEFGDEHGYSAEFGYGYPAFGVDYYGAEAGTPVPSPGPMATAAQQLAWQAQQTSRRNTLLEPNKGSAIKVERYNFSINQTLTLGLAAVLNMTGQPDTTIRPQRVTMNAPSSGFATINEIKVANVSVTVGGISDGFEYNALGVGQSLDMPTLSPANRASVLGNYTGFVPPGFVAASSYIFCVSFKGPASIVA